jgi:O-acetyl-ADP-ribose deacetylase (regulator of RNase III)
MKQIAFGNILTVKEGIIVHGCNAQGVMGSGIANEIRAAYPWCFKAYVEFILAHQGVGKSPMGKVCAYKVPDTNLVIANAITQDHFGKDGKKYVSYKAIAEAFTEICCAAENLGHVVHYPMIGAGLGGGDWAVINDIIDNVFAHFPTIERMFWIYE